MSHKYVLRLKWSSELGKEQEHHGTIEANHEVEATGYNYKNSYNDSACLNETRATYLAIG